MADKDPLSKLHPNRSQLLHNVQANFGPGRIPPPMSTTSFILQPPNTPAAVSFARNNVTGPRNYRRVPASYLHSPVGTFNSHPGYPNRPYSSIDEYNNPFNTFRQPLMPPQMPTFQNPIIIAASENSRPAFEHIYTVLRSFNALYVMMETTYNAIQMTFNSVLGVADNFVQLKVFMMKIYSAIVSIRLAQWFLTKIINLSRMVNGNKRMSAEERVWASLSTTEVHGNDTEQTWPILLYSGILAAIPYALYKLFTLKTPNSSRFKEVLEGSTETFTIRSVADWDNQSLPGTIPLVKGQLYGTNNAKLALSYQNGGWLFVENKNGQKGLVPVQKLANHRSDNTQFQPIPPEIPDTAPQNIQTVNQNDVIREQMQPFEDFDELEDYWEH